ncbi:hypothetical protein ACVV37_12160 [Escherichia coli]
MTNDAIKIVSVRKSARLGYTKILVAALLYFAEHKNVVPWSISLSMTNRMDLSPTRLTRYRRNASDSENFPRLG